MLELLRIRKPPAKHLTFGAVKYARRRRNSLGACTVEGIPDIHNIVKPIRLWTRTESCGLPVVSDRGLGRCNETPEDTRLFDHIIRFYSYLYLIIYLMQFTPTFFGFSHVFTLHLYLNLTRNISFGLLLLSFEMLLKDHIQRLL